MGLSDLNSYGYYNKTINTCKLKLHIPLDLINNKIYPKLLEKNEVAGVFHILNDKITDVDIKEGDEFTTRVIGQRFELNDKYISIIGEIVKQKKYA